MRREWKASKTNDIVGDEGITIERNERGRRGWRWGTLLWLSPTLGHQVQICCRPFKVTPMVNRNAHEDYR